MLVYIQKSNLNILTPLFELIATFIASNDYQQYSYAISKLSNGFAITAFGLKWHLTSISTKNLMID